LSEDGREAEEEPGREAGSARHKLPQLSLGMRVVAFVLGWGLVLVGIAGLALPGIQGVLTLLAGTAVLSVVSETVYRLLRRLFRRWPSGWKRVHGFRNRVHGWLHRKRPGASSPPAPGDAKPPEDPD
jgi:hypothetical protein